MKYRKSGQGIKTLEEAIHAINDISYHLDRILNGGVRIADNFEAAEVTHAFTTVDTEEAISHTLGKIPVGYLKKTSETGMVIYGTPGLGTAWTDANIYLLATLTGTATFYVY